MSNKQNKKLRQLVRRNEYKLVGTSWDVFFETISQMPKRQRKKIARLIKKGVDIRKLQKVIDVGTRDTGN